MPDDALGELGLDITPFRKAIADARAKIESMSPTIQKMNAAIFSMEKDSAKAAAAVKTHQTAIVNLGNELRKLQGVHVALGTAQSKENQDRLARIEQLKQEIKLQSDLAAKARGRVSALGAAIPGAKAEAEKATSGVQRAVAAEQAEEQAVEAQRQGAFLSRAGLIAGISGILYKLGNAIMQLGDKASEAIEKFQRGGSRLEAQSPDRGSAALSAGVQPIVEDATASFSNRIASVALGAAASIGGMIDKLLQKFGADSAGNWWEGIAAIQKEGEEALKAREAIAETEDGLADLLKTQTVEYDSQLGILNQQLVIEQKKLDLSNLDTIQGRQAANQAKAAIGALQMQVREMQYRREVSRLAMAAEISETQLKQQGMANAAEMVKIEADYRAKIVQAMREGNTELAGQLEWQKQLALNENKVAAHNLSPRELVNERREARKFNRDLEHQNDRERDIQDRERRGVHGATPGSRFDRFQVGRRAIAGNAQNMTVNNITSTNLAVTNFKVGNL